LTAVFRYLLLVWNPSDAQQCGVATELRRRALSVLGQWQEVECTQGLFVMASRLSASHGGWLSLGGEAGVILGQLFRRPRGESAGDVVGNLTAAESREIIGSEGRHLVTHFWGRYVAVIRGLETDGVSVIRDPSGTLPCWMTSYRSIHVMFSDVGDCAKLGWAGFSLNWDLLSVLAAGMSRPLNGETALLGLDELRAGECWQIKGSAAVRHFCWNPVDFAGEDSIEDFERAAQMLRATVRACVQSWRSLFSSILHSLSGGLDSSIVLSALAQSPRGPVTALNLYTPTLEGDERALAQKAADYLGVPLVQRQLDGTTVDPGRLWEMGLSPFPEPGCVTELLTGAIEQRVAADTGAEALFSGVGGDGVFLQSGARWSTADFIRTRGIRWSLLQVAHDEAQMTAESVWTVLGSGIASHWKHAASHPRPGQTLNSFLRVEVMERARHRWRQASQLPYPKAEGLPPGKRWHIRVSSFSGYYYRPFAALERPEGVYPLVSQPIRELCLRMPLHLMFRGGVDRAVARSAFAGDLPAEIIHRVFKGQANQVNRDILDGHLPYLRECLLGGELARQRLIDVPRLERFLGGERPGGIAEVIQCNQIMATLLPIEAFIQRWELELGRAA
jgi:asparagine synthase (glutamine-hydrolysing)